MSTDYSDATSEMRDDIAELKQAQAVMAAEEAGAHATQAAVQAGDAATQAAAHAGTWSTMTAAAGGFIVGIFMALAVVAVAKD